MSITFGTTPINYSGITSKVFEKSRHNFLKVERVRITIFDSIYFSEKMWIHLNVYVNSQNYHLWYSENLHEFMESGLHPKKIGI